MRGGNGWRCWALTGTHGCLDRTILHWHWQTHLSSSSKYCEERSEKERLIFCLKQKKKGFNLQSSLWGVWPTSRDVKIEEIAVKDGLHHSRHHGDLVEEAFCVIAPHPVCDVESAVQAKEEQVVCRDGLRLPGFGDHEELRHNGHGLQEDGEGPQDLGGTTRKGKVKPRHSLGWHSQTDHQALN